MAAALRHAIRKTKAMYLRNIERLVPEPIYDEPHLVELGEDVLVPEPVIEELGLVRLEPEEMRFDEQGRVIIDFDEELKTGGKLHRRAPQDDRPVAIDMLPDGKLIDGPMVDLLVDGPMF